MIVNDNINYLLIDIEPMSIFESIDVRSVTSKPEFPSEEFGDFMELLAKWNLSDACGSDILKFSKKICHDNVNLPMLVKQGRQLDAHDGLAAERAELARHEARAGGEPAHRRLVRDAH